jgi:hypothetical protein
LVVAAEGVVVLVVLELVFLEVAQLQIIIVGVLVVKVLVVLPVVLVGAGVVMELRVLRDIMLPVVRVGLLGHI